MSVEYKKGGRSQSIKLRASELQFYLLFKFFWILVVTVCDTNVNMLEFCILATEGIYVFFTWT